MRTLAVLGAVAVLAVCARAGVAQSSAAPPASPAPQGPLVYVIAPSPSTQAEARRILRLCRWSDTTAVLDADALLVVVRSSSGDPLASQYDSLQWLRSAVSSLENESGAQFHLYLFQARQDFSFLKLTQFSHRSYDVDDAGRNPSLTHCTFLCACW